MNFLSQLNERKTRLFGFLLLLGLGFALASYLIPTEAAQMSWEIPGEPTDYPVVHKIRPILIGIACFIPAFIALLFCFAQTLDRYMAASLLRSFGLTTGIIFLIWLLGDFSANVSDIVANDSPFRSMFKFYANQLPMVGVLILPYSLLLATLWALTMLSRSSEITAMIQSGRSLARLTLPMIIIGFCVTVYTTIFNYQWAPSANLYRRLAFNENQRNKASKNESLPAPIIYRNEKDNRIWNIRYFPTLGDPSSPFHDIHVEQLSSPGRLKTEYFAESCSWNPSQKSWTFHNVIVREHGDHETDIPTFTSEKSIPSLELDFRETPWLLITPGTRIDTRSVPDLHLRLTQGILGERDRLQFETHRQLRFAQGFSAFVLLLLAIPCGVSVSRRGGLSGIGIALGLSGCMIFGFEVFPSLSSAGYIPPFLGAWLPNIIFLFIAFYLFRTRLSHKNMKDYYQAMKKRLGFRKNSTHPPTTGSNDSVQH